MHNITHKFKDKYTFNTFVVRNLNGKKLKMLLAQHTFGTVYIVYHATTYTVMPLCLSMYF